MEKSFYYIVSWDAAARYSKELTEMGIPHIVEDPTTALHLHVGKLAIVLPNLHVRKYSDVRQLFGGDPMLYP